MTGVGQKRLLVVALLMQGHSQPFSPYTARCLGRKVLTDMAVAVTKRVLF